MYIYIESQKITHAKHLPIPPALVPIAQTQKNLGRLPFFRLRNDPGSRITNAIENALYCVSSALMPSLSYYNYDHLLFLDKGIDAVDDDRSG